MYVCMYVLYICTICMYVCMYVCMNEVSSGASVNSDDQSRRSNGSHRSRATNISLQSSSLDAYLTHSKKYTSCRHFHAYFHFNMENLNALIYIHTYIHTYLYKYFVTYIHTYIHNNKYLDTLIYIHTLLLMYIPIY